MKERPALSTCTVGIYGLGLMGGSFASALKRLVPHCTILGVDTRESAVAWGLDNGIIDRGSADAPLLREAQFVVLATPVGEIKRWLTVEAGSLDEGTVILDLGSTKQEIVDIMEKLPGTLHALGGHPMAGKETSGIESSDRDLFSGAPFFLVPTSRLPASVCREVSALVSSMGARPIVIDASTHDRIAAASSHVPYLASVCLTLAIEELSQKEDLCSTFIASGFRDTSRLAACQPSMTVPMCTSNRANVRRHLQILIQKAEGIMQMLEDGDDEGLMKECERAMGIRESLIP